MADFISKARKGRLAALRGRNSTMLFPEVEQRTERRTARAPDSLAALRARRSVSLFG